MVVVVTSCLFLTFLFVFKHKFYKKSIICLVYRPDGKEQELNFPPDFLRRNHFFRIGNEIGGSRPILGSCAAFYSAPAHLILIPDSHTTSTYDSRFSALSNR